MALHPASPTDRRLRASKVSRFFWHNLTHSVQESIEIPTTPWAPAWMQDPNHNPPRADLTKTK